MATPASCPLSMALAMLLAAWPNSILRVVVAAKPTSTLPLFLLLPDHSQFPDSGVCLVRSKQHRSVVGSLCVFMQAFHARISPQACSLNSAAHSSSGTLMLFIETKTAGGLVRREFAASAHPNASARSRLLSLTSYRQN